MINSRNNPAPNIQIYGQRIDTVNIFKNLGSWLPSRTERGRTAFNKIINLLCNQSMKRYKYALRSSESFRNVGLPTTLEDPKNRTCTCPRSSKERERES